MLGLRTIQHFLLAVTILSTAACAADPSESIVPDNNNGQIIGGEYVATNDPFGSSVVRLIVGSSLCSGSIIAQNLILTSAHCFKNIDLKKDISKVTVFFGLKVNQQIQKSASEVKLYYKPGSDDFQAEDVAVVRFNGGLPKGFKTAPVNLEPVQFGSNSEFLSYGYGKIDEQTLAQSLKRATLIFDDTLIAGFAFDQSKNNPGICKGDSGGPVFGRASSKEAFAIVAINKAIYNTTEEVGFCRGQGIAIRTSYVADFISAELQISKKLSTH